jgi:hypothetical protein
MTTAPQKAILHSILPLAILAVAAVTAVSVVLLPNVALACNCVCNGSSISPSTAENFAICESKCGVDGIASSSDCSATPQTTTAPTKPSAPSTAPTGGAVGLPTPLGVGSVQTVVGNVISAAAGLMGSVAFLMFLYGGWLWFSSQGDQKKITQAKETLIWAAVGLVVVFGAYIIVNTVIKLLTQAGA